MLLPPVLLALLLALVALSALTGPTALRWAATGVLAALALAVAAAAAAVWRLAGHLRARRESEDRRRRQFLADVAHELRTPLSVIRAQVEAIGDGVYPADSEHLTPVLDATRSLERLVEDLRTLALSEADALELAVERVDAGELLSDVAAAHRAAATDAGVELVLEPASVSLEGDPIRLRSVLDNLLANALRHTSRGGHIQLRAGADGSWAVIEVADDGSGIPAELLPVIFERFARGPESRGSGLGLAIAREIVAAHGGTIAADSQPGHGSTFTIRLPLR